MKEKKLPSFNYKDCMCCGVCIVACPFSCLELSKVGLDSYNKTYPDFSDINKCTGCGVCQKSCPLDVIT